MTGGMNWDRARQRDLVRDRGVDPIARPSNAPSAEQLEYIKRLRHRLRSAETWMPDTRASASAEIDVLKATLAERRAARRRRRHPSM